MGSKPCGLPLYLAAFQQQNFKPGGDKQDRTADLLHAMQALSQLSYTPKLTSLAFTSFRRFQALNYSAQITLHAKILKLFPFCTVQAPHQAREFGLSPAQAP